MKRPAAKLTRTAFTLIEMLIVIAVILILVSIGVTGFRSMELSASKKQTVTTLASGNSMVRELAATGAYNRLYGPSTLIPAPVFKDTDGPIPNPGDVNLGQGTRTNLLNDTQQRNVMQLLLSVPKNSQIVSALPPQATVAPAGGSPVTPPRLADAWGNPLVYVGPAGMAGLTVNGVGNQTVRSTGGTTASPQDRGFWMSAGPDGNFTTFDDNIISVQP